MKDVGEVEPASGAADIADSAFAESASAPGTGPNRAVRGRLTPLRHARGADGLSFDTIVASGPNGALPHAQPSARELALGDLVVVDFGASVDGYGGDMTRTVVVQGTVRRPDKNELYDVVLRAQDAGVAGLGDGVTAAHRSIESVVQRAERWLQ
ncbi:MAG: M24 family metallopeptidase [Acidimicrobiales bacterium]